MINSGRFKTRVPRLFFNFFLRLWLALLCDFNTDLNNVAATIVKNDMPAKIRKVKFKPSDSSDSAVVIKKPIAIIDPPKFIKPFARPSRLLK